MKKVIIISLLLLSACTTALWEKDFYVESLTGFHVSPEKNILIVSGQKYSYIFEIDDNFKALLAASRKIEFTPSFYDFEIDSNNKVNGNAFFMASKKTSEADSAYIKTIGFQQNDAGSYFYKVNLKGARYRVEGELPFVMLEDSHEVRIEEPHSFIGTIGKIIATPATLTIDVIGGVAVGTLIALTMGAASITAD